MATNGGKRPWQTLPASPVKPESMDVNMTTNAHPTDVIDRLLGLKPGDAAHDLRHARKKVVDATQTFHDLAFSAPGLSIAQRRDRLLAAAVSAQATGPASLAEEYGRQLLETGPDDAYRAALDGRPDSGSAALDTLARYARTLALEPASADRQALLALAQAGWNTPEVVSLAQIMGYVSYQSRLMVGLTALAELAAAAPASAEPAEDPAFVHPAHLPAPGERLDINGYTNATLGWKSWLPIQDVGQLTATQSAILDTSHPTARESDYYMLLVRAPELLEQRSLVYNAIMYAPGGGARHERELAAAAVSRLNGCVYCTSVHAQRFEQLSKRNDVIAQVFTDPRSAGTTARERAIVQTSLALTENPSGFSAASLRPLTDQGMTPEQIRDVLSSVAIFAWANRLMMNLGEHVMPEQG